MLTFFAFLFLRLFYFLTFCSFALLPPLSTASPSSSLKLHSPKANQTTAPVQTGSKAIKPTTNYQTLFKEKISLFSVENASSGMSTRDAISTHPCLPCYSQFTRCDCQQQFVKKRTWLYFFIYNNIKNTVIPRSS